MADARLDLAARLGVLGAYTDQTGTRRETGVDTAVALMAAMGIDAARETDARDLVRGALPSLPRDVVCEAGRVPDLACDDDWTLQLEDGERVEGRGALPALPLGIHALETNGQAITLLAAPPRLPLPPPAWGVIVPLYGLASEGIGRFDDLGPLASALAALGADFLGLNPVHAGFPADPGLPSPYTPSHRRRLNATYLTGGSGSTGALIDYAADLPARLAALEAEFAAAPTDPAFETWRAKGGAALGRFAAHQALSERHGPFWTDWPQALRDPAHPDVAVATGALAERMRFHAWLQWRAEAALAAAQDRARAAGMAQGLYLDLAVGTHPAGAETWEDRESFAYGATLGAPPDAFSAEGQDWQLAPFNPRTLAARRYAPLAETLRRQLEVSGLLRIDHILGFERAFWVPPDAPGGYVQMPRDAMLAIARIEAARAGATLVGEDLGNIPKGLRAALDSSGILGCRVAMFERTSWDPPVFRDHADWDEAAIASFSTHDLPTWEGWLAGADLAARRDVGDMDDARLTAERAHRETEIEALTDRIGGRAMRDLHRFLAATPARLVAIQAEIALAQIDQPNLPGTVNEYPNWRRRLPLPPGGLAAADGLEEAAAIMRAAGRGRAAVRSDGAQATARKGDMP